MIYKFYTTLLILVFLLFGQFAMAQEDLLSLLDEEEETSIVEYAFKTSRIINLHSIENTHRGELDFKISHRFGFVNTGAKELFGLDQSSIRLGLEYGVFDRLMVGVGRSSFEKTFDAFFKYRLVRQKTGAKAYPISFSIFSSVALKTSDFPDPDRDNYFSSRLYYTWQVLMASKITPALSLQLTPTIVHRNLVETLNEENDVLALGIGGRLKVSNRVTINAEYILANQKALSSDRTNSLSLGVDIETGGHVFQLHMTNSTSMIEKGFITENTGNFFEGDIRFGFNIARVFTLRKPEDFRKRKK